MAQTATWTAVPYEGRLDFYRRMTLVRRFEEAAQRAFRRGRFAGYLHLYVGQEAVAAGFLDAYRPGDVVITAYRDHAHALLLGSDPGAVMAELFGKATGVAKGKGGSMHLFDIERGLWGGYGIVGGHIPLGAGMAYAQRYRGENGIVQLYLGDGAVHNGAFHEAANLAGLWGRDGMCPVLFVVENNGYGMGTSVARATAMTDLGRKFDSYGIEHEAVDGMDLDAVLACARRAAARVRESGAPYAVEALTYRLVPYGAADPGKYRAKDEVAAWHERDPIALWERRLLEAGVTDEQLASLREQARRAVDEALRFAEASPEPPLTELLGDVYGHAR